MRKNKLAITALIIAVFGGFPGAISILNYLHTPQIIFGFKPDVYLHGTLPPKYGSKKIFMLTGTVTNEGDKSLIPRYFDLKIKIEDKWISLERTIIPQDYEFEQTKPQVTKIEGAADRDLLRYIRPITKEEPAYGHLLFTSDELDIKALKASMYKRNSITFELSCISIYDEKYIVTQTNDLDRIDGLRELPKQGILYGPKEK